MPRGRPPKADARRANLSTRCRDDLREALEASAKRNHRTLSEEVEFRLEVSSRDESQPTRDQWIEARLAEIERKFIARITALEQKLTTFEDEPAPVYENNRQTQHAILKELRDVARTQDSNTRTLLRIAASLADETSRLVRIEAALNGTC